MRSPHNKSMLTVRASGLLQRIILNGFLPIFLFFSSVNAYPAIDGLGSHAYATRQPLAVYPHITSLAAVRLQDLTDANSIALAAQTAVDATALMPQGQRTLLNVDLDFLALAQNAVTATDAAGKTVQVTTANGALLPDHGIWLDQGVAVARQRVLAFFQAYQQRQGQLDRVALEYSGLGLSADDVKAAGDASGGLTAYLAAIEADPRFATEDLATQLGFSDLSLMYAGDAQAATLQARWNAVMKQRVAAYLQQAFYQPLARVYPQAQVAARDYYRQTPDFTVPGSAFQNTQGALAGNAQGRNLTGILPDAGLQIDGAAYPATPFNAFRYETNRLRSMVLSSPESVFPTLNPPNPAAASGMSALLAGSDLYQEMVIHAALTGARQFVYQNTSATADQETTLNKTLQEVDAVLGVSAANTTVDNLSAWQQPFVLTSARGANGTVWRFSPQLDATTPLANTILQQQPAVFAVAGLQVTVPAAQVHSVDNSASAQGVWLTESENPLATNCPQPLAVGRECVAYYAGDALAAPATLLVEKTAPAVDNAGAATVLFARDWKSGGADAAAGRDQFTVQYNANLDLPAGLYQFVIKADDQVRLWVDDQLLLDGNVAETTAARNLSADVALSGLHTLKLEYTDLADEAVLELGMQRLASSAADDCSTVPSGKFCGQFFSNRLLSGTPAAIASTPTIAFDWGNGKPLPSLPAADNFSSRWVGDFQFAAGNYTFTTTADDGVRVWVDDELLVDAWKDQPPATYFKSKTLSAGKHRVKMEYYERGGGAVAKLNWEKTQSCDNIPTGQFCAEYYNNVDFVGNPAKIQNETAINYEWQDGVPAQGVNADNFAVRWQGDFELAGDYRFLAKVDDRMRVWVGDDLIINLWESNDAKEHFHDVSLPAGKHRIKVEMREYGGWARAMMSWEQRADCEGAPDNAFCGAFYAGDALAGEVLRTQKVNALNVNWGTGRVMHGVPADMFSARWLGKFDFPTSGYYRFNTEMDDGVKVWVGDQLVIDQWSSDWRWSGKAQSAPFIEAGNHTVKVEYRERYGAAFLNLGWQLVDGCGTTPENAFCLSYFNNQELTGIPAQVLKTPAMIDYAWGDAQPEPMVWRDAFSARWVGKVNFEDATYRFATDVDDGVRIWVDGDELPLNAWSQVWPNYGKYQLLKKMSPGLHDLKIEYRDSWAAAKAKVTWEKAPDCSTVPDGQFCAAFFNGIGLQGAPLDTRLDNAINFDWQYESPTPAVPRDNFSARWVGNFTFAEGEYTFTARTDDGFRLWVGGKPLIDSWKPQGATTYTKRVFLTEGTHEVKVEYYESGGGAVAQLAWQVDLSGQPQAPVNLKTSQVTQTAATLDWTAQELASSYRVYRDGELVATVTTPKFTDTDVAVTQSYAYRVTALWASGRESLPSTLNVTIPDTQAPTQPANLRAQAVTGDSIQLVWQAASDNVAVARYRVLRDGVQVAETTTPSFTDNGVSSFSRYAYNVLALDAAGNVSLMSNPLTAYTSDGTPPSVPQALQAFADKGQVTLSWQAATDNVGVAAYRVLRDGQEIGTSTAARFGDTSVQQNTTYRYQVVAVDSAGNRSESSAAVSLLSGDSTAPSAPANMSANADATRLQVALRWDAANDNVGVAQYRVLRNGRLLAVSKLATYTDTDVQLGNTYRYSVTAEDAAGNASIASNAVETSLSAICESTQLYYQQQVETHVGNCASCHVAGGMAQNSRLIFSTGDNASARNLNALNAITQTVGKTTVLQKASGQVAHGGGAVLPVGSDALQVFTTLLDKLADPQQCDAVNTSTGVAVLVESMAANCASCHGTNGVSHGPATPGLAGMDSHYFSKLMRDYQTGNRASTVMGRIAKGYSAQEIDQLATFFVAQTFKVTEQTTDAAQVARGQGLHQQYCASCHTANGRDDSLTGVRLAGQWQPYLERTLQDYATKRSHAPTGMANQLSALLAREDGEALNALAAFYASSSADSQAPDAPEYVEVAAYTPTGVTLTWMDASDEWGVSYYEIYRDGVLIGRSRYNSFTDTGLAQGSYRYTIVAVDASGNRSVVSNEVVASVSSETATPNGVQLLDYPETLRKAAVLLLNRTPTAAELAAVTSEETFRSTLRTMLDAAGALNPFVYRAGHEVFLSNGAARVNSGNGGIQTMDFPALATLTTEEMNIVSDTIRKEPVFLMQYIVGSDRPWTEVLTADYTVLNPMLSKALGAQPLEAFTNATDQNELRPARIPQVSARFANKPFPHAGVLTTNAWLSRFPTTDTNRNRHRASKVYKQFLGLNIEALAQRPLNDSGNGNFRVPTIENPNCMVCHTVMDPVAGAFKEWGNNARYLQNFNGTQGDKDSLAGAYKSSSYPLSHLGQAWYQKGDLWYRDMLMPGLDGKAMPGGFTGFGSETWVDSVNLLVNPSAESGVSGWTTVTGKAEASNKAGCSRITRDPKSGQALFHLGVCNQVTAETLLQQTIDITSHASVVDAGKAAVNYGAYMSTKGSGDIPSVWVTFVGADDKVLGESRILLETIGWTWGNQKAEQAVPVGTRHLRFNLRGVRSPNTWADKFLDVYADDVFLTLKTPASNVAAAEGLQDSLQWLGKHLVADQRFAKGGVHFWYRTLFKREPLTAPVNPAAEGYAQQMAAFNEQDAQITTLAEQFRQDSGHGVWNVKDLLINMVASPLFRAESGYLDATGKQAIPDLGIARLLTPEEINGKLKSLVGAEWSSFRPERAWSDRMGLFYGGFDGGSLKPTPNTEMNTLMSKIPERMAIELSCNTVYNDFLNKATERKLFRFVEATDTPTLEELGDSQANMLLNPGAEQGMASWVIEQGTARILSGKSGCDGGPSIRNGQAIFNPGSICKTPTPLGRMYQDVDVTAWATTIDAGQGRAVFGAALRGWSTNNDEASISLSFRDASGVEIGTSAVLSSARDRWENFSTSTNVPANTRLIRFVMQGRNLGAANSNTDAFVDDTYLRVVANGSDYMAVGEKRIRSNIQFLHKHLLNEDLPLDDAEIDRTYRLFSEVQADASGVGTSACRLYNDWEDPQRTKRAWSIVMMYLLTDARFLYE
ncbi:PA14 domain-containing protein [Thiothrix unzii]|uniref:PA14 domain-containing protein n=1 Tax=Thiothrix unzii TaxID=111769 RepID=UPI002A367416|nr:PA14 domain-containing protein [Thiothrix unzii]MDX9990211.1 PA14 domain-containing protein [Thiothrix unzii]